MKTPITVPQGRKTIARQFIAGCMRTTGLVPSGTEERPLAPANRAKLAVVSLAIWALLSCAFAQVQDGSAAKVKNAPQPQTITRIIGKAVETTNAGPYTYVLINTGKEKVWAAAPEFKVKAGDEIRIDNAMEMGAFHSKTLGRDFDRVFFTGEVNVNGVTATPAAPPPARSPQSASLPKGHPSITGSDAPAKVDLSGIKKAVGGRTVQEIFAEKSKLNGQSIAVRGRVVKYNENILGKNWLHLRDGTGAPGSNDLLVTTTTPAKVGDTVLASGPIVLNKDFGSNYKYDVMLDNAKVTVE